MEPAFEQRAVREGDEHDVFRTEAVVGDAARSAQALQDSVWIAAERAAQPGGLKRRVDKRFHPYWGSLLKEHNELSLFGHRMLVNSGVSCYGDSRERLRQRATAAHNTVVIDGEKLGKIEAMPKMEGRQMVMVAAPLKH